MLKMTPFRIPYVEIQNPLLAIFVMNNENPGIELI